MQIVKTPFWRPADRVVEESYRVIKNGGVVVGPTDTVYGVFSDVYSDEYVERVYSVKQRRKDKPLPILASNIDAVEEIVSLNDKLRSFLKAVWPGPITVVFNNVDCSLFSKLLCRDNSVALRVPAAPFPRKLAEMNGGFITGSSANLSGRPSPLRVEDAIKYFGDKINLYVDSGEAPLKVSSTIISIMNGKIALIRQGAVDYIVITRIYHRMMRC
ncbi:MAG: threonylcarbamoyl-AMP synthase [Crenarchaeota archaeon]|nr:threonylcarbamoyl-AMP synthase [Thermoproteota archaeon]